MPRRATDKRQKLVAAAIERFHREGYSRTSLADVAKTAGIAPGNVFYYFKAKDALAVAVIDEWCARLSGYLADIEAQDDAWGRLERFVAHAHSMREIYVTLGCPLAGLSRDLRQENDALKRDVARIYETQLNWLKNQFLQGGTPQKEAEILSRTLMSDYHGSIHLAFAQDDPSFIDEGVTRLTKWLRNVRDTEAKAPSQHQPGPRQG